MSPPHTNLSERNAKRARKTKRDEPPSENRPATTAWFLSDWALAGALGVLTLLLFLPCIGNEFSGMDDNHYVTGNDVVRQGLTLHGVQYAFTNAVFANWLPVTLLSHMLDVSLYGLQPAGHHFTSVLLHALNAVLLFWGLRKLTGFRYRSIAVAALFALHPLRVESIAWIAERKDVLCATFFFLTLIAYANYVRRPTVWRYLLIMVLLAMGLMSKTMLVSVPPLLLLLDVWPLRRWRLGNLPPPADDAPMAILKPQPLPKLLLEKVPLLVLVAAASYWTIRFQDIGRALELNDEVSLGQRAANGVISIWRYIGKMLLPTELSPYYPYPKSWPMYLVIGSLVLLVAVTLVAVRFWRRAPYLLIGWLWFLGMLFPVSGVLIQAGRQSIADRYTYLSGIGLTIALVWLIADGMRHRQWLRRAVSFALPILLVSYAAGSYVQEQLWKNDLELFTYAVELDNNNWFAQEVLGRDLRDRGQFAEAIDHLRQSLAAEPRNDPVRLDLAVLLLATKQSREAAAQFQEFVRRNEKSAEGRLGLARALFEDRQFAAADAQFAEAVQLNPQNPDMQAQWAFALARQRRKQEAIDHARAALRLDPENAAAKAAIALAEKSQ